MMFSRLLNGCFLLLLFAASLPLIAGETALEINANGANGSQGKKGADGADGHNGYARPLNDAGHAKPGENGGAGEAAKTVLLEGKPTSQGYRVRGRVGDTAIDRDLYIYAPIDGSAEGGDGGNGGDGGRGGDGGTGSTGTPGNRQHGGGRGGQGGAAGDGGNPGSGGNAGAGGTFIFEVDEEDTFLLRQFLREPPTKAGKPGRAGVRGSAGSPGRGGAGGRGAHWTEKKKVTIPSYSEKVVNNEDQSVSYITHPSRDEWVDDPKSTPDGEEGPSGPSASDGHESWARNGAKAANGSFRFVIRYRDGKIRSFTYDQLYDFFVASDYGVTDTNDDGIWEPAEVGIVDGLSIANNGGGMDTPAPHQSAAGAVVVRLSLDGDAWHTPSNSLDLPKSLQQRENFKFPQSMGFKIRDIDGPSLNKPLSEIFTLAPRVVMMPTGARFPQPQAARTLGVQFPAQIKFSAPPTLSPGAHGIVRVVVSNVSRKPLGAAELSKRVLSFLIKDEGGGSIPMAFKDASGKTLGLEQGLEQALPSLAAGDTQTFTFKIYVPKEYKPYSSYPFHAELNLGRLSDASNGRAIQKEEHSVSVALKYETDLDADMVIITNQNTSAEEIAAWHELVEKRLGFKLSTWNASLYANLDLFHEALKGRLAKWTLGKDFANKSMIVLNNEFRGFSGTRGLTAYESLSKKAIGTAVGTYNIRFLFIGGAAKVKKDLKRLMTYTGPAAHNSRTYLSRNELIRSLDILHQETASQKDRTPLTGDLHKIRVISTQWYAPTSEQLQRQANDLQGDLDSRWPHRRYLVTADFQGARLAEQWGRDKYHVGDLIVQRQYNHNDKPIVVSDVSDEAMHTEAYVESTVNLAKLFASLSTDTKMILLNRLVGKLNSHEDDEYYERVTTQLVDVITTDIAHNYEAALRGGSGLGSASPKTMQRLVLGPFAHRVEPDTTAEKLMTRLYMRAKIAGYFSYSDWTSLNSKAEVSYETTATLLDKWAKALFVDPSAWLHLRSARHPEWIELMATVGVDRDMAWNSTKHAKIKAYLTQKESVADHDADTEVDTDDVYAIPAERVISYDDVQGMRAHDNETRERWEKQTASDLDAKDESEK